LQKIIKSEYTDFLHKPEIPEVLIKYSKRNFEILKFKGTIGGKQNEKRFKKFYW
jgi:hypothetical protein